MPRCKRQSLIKSEVLSDCICHRWKKGQVCCGQRYGVPLPASSREHQKMLLQVICSHLLYDSSSDSSVWLHRILTSVLSVNCGSSVLLQLLNLRWLSGVFAVVIWSVRGLGIACFLLGCFTPQFYCSISPLTLQLFAAFFSRNTDINLY